MKKQSESQKEMIRSRIGEIGIASNGQRMRIIDYVNSGDITVQFEDGTIVKHRSYYCFKHGGIRNENMRKPVNVKIKHTDRVGETNISSKGQRMKIIRYGMSTDVDIQFEDGTIVKHKDYKMFKRGYITNPNIVENHIGEKHISNNGQTMVIIRYSNSKDIDVQFEDGTIVRNKSYTHFSSGKIANPNLSVAKSRIGETKKLNNGHIGKIIAYRRAHDIDILLDDGTIVKNREYSSFKRGTIAKNYRKSSREEKLPENRIGETMKSLNGQMLKITRYNNSGDISVQFDDGTVINNTNYAAFYNDKIRNPNAPYSTRYKVGVYYGFTVINYAFTEEDTGLQCFECVCNKCRLHSILNVHEMYLHERKCK